MIFVGNGVEYVCASNCTRHYKCDKEAIYTHVNDIFTSIEKYVAQEDQNLSTYHRKQKAYETLTAFCLGFNEQEKPIQQNLF